MKRLKRGLLAFLVGEFFALFKKDEAFKEGVLQKKGWSRWDHIFDGLFDFNKELVDDARERFDTQALENQLHAGVNRVHKEYEHLVHELALLKEHGGSLTEELKEKLDQRLASLKRTAELIKDQLHNFESEKKIAELKKTLESLAKRKRNS